MKILFYDGDCGLCDRFVAWALAADPSRRAAPLGGPTALETLTTRATDTVVLRDDDGEWTRSDAALRILATKHPAAKLLTLVPRPLRDAVYRLVAAVRRRLFPLPPCPRVHPFRDRLLP